MLKKMKISRQIYVLTAMAILVTFASMTLNIIGLMTSNSMDTYRTLVTGLLVLLLLVTGSLIYFSKQIAKQISNSVGHISDFALKVNKGDLSIRTKMGNPVNCSEIKKCDHPDCPSYGKESHCWVESGSFSNHPVCPRALKGEDCRTCEIYVHSVTNEFEEMGSALNAVIDELSIKAEVIREVSNGNMDQQVHVVSEFDTLGQSLETMVASLNRVFNGFKQFVKQITSSSQQVSEANHTLSVGASKQASSIQEITSSLNEIASQVATNAERAESAAELAKMAESSASKGDLQIDSMVTAISGINESSQQIVKIIKVIDEIAFQTNLLALNAAVEAARAGKFGKGFAVVAEEVRNLAVRATAAAKETNELIDNSASKVDAGAHIAEETARVLKEIIVSVNELSQIMGEISFSNKDQALGVSEINQGVEQIEQVIQQNAAHSEQNAASSEELSAQSAQFNKVMEQFRTIASHSV